MKTLIGIWHSGGKGKSSTVRYLADILIGIGAVIKYEENYYLVGYDCTLILEFRSKIIALIATGDPNTNLRGRLSEIIKMYSPDIIVCTSRTRGQTVHDVNTLKGMYEIIWTSTYDTEVVGDHRLLNKTKAEHILDLLVKMGRI